MGNSPALYELWRNSAKQDSGDTIVTVSIGRKENGQVMGPVTWETFQAETSYALKRTVGTVTYSVSGESQWKGQTEPSVSFSVVGADISPVKLERLRGMLHTLAHVFGQESIGLTVGHSELVDAVKP